MSDLADMADNTMAVHHLVSLHQSRRDVPKSTSTGFCWHCEQPVPVGYRWCDADCRDDWQRDED